MEKIKYLIKERSEKVHMPENLGFGLIYTDHIFEMDYEPGKGWHNPTIKPIEKLSIHPATMFIHYAQAIFEGLKAFKTQSGEAVIFRADRHINRLNRSARRICIPEVDPQFVLQAMSELVSIEKDWIPTREQEALYIRPFIFGSDLFLGVRPSTKYKFIILLSPVGAYYPEGFKPVKILAQDDYVRAVRKGMGECKTPANYAASLLAGQKAKEQGFTQVLWLDGIEQKYIEEVGTMNIFIQFKKEIATPKLIGTVLPGITRESVIRILQDRGYTVNERLISIDEVINEYNKGNVLRIFGTGTAAVISPVGLLSYKGFEMNFNYSDPDDLAVELFKEITAMQRAQIEDRYNWLTYVDKKGVEV